MSIRGRTTNRLHRNEGALPPSGGAGESRLRSANTECANPRVQKSRIRNTKRGLRSLDAIELRKSKRKFIRREARRWVRRNQQALTFPTIVGQDDIPRKRTTTSKPRSLNMNKLKAGQIAKNVWTIKQCLNTNDIHTLNRSSIPQLYLTHKQM